MDFGITADQESLRSSVRELLAREWPDSLLRAVASEEAPFPMELWGEMAAERLLGLPLPKRYGGAGLGFVELAIVLEEMGHRLVPGPYLSTAACGLAVLEFGTEDQRADLLPAIASGELTMSLALAEPGGSRSNEGVHLRAEPSAGGYVLNGVKTLVSAAADRLLVVARTSAAGGPEDEPTLFVVDSQIPGVAESRLPVMGIDRLSEVAFRDVWTPPHSLLGPVNGAGPLVEKLSAWDGVGRCAELVGGAQAVLDMTVEYVKQRQAFGRPIGSFQAVQRHCADMLADLEAARCLTRQAAWLVSRGHHSSPEVSMAQAWTGEAFRRVTATAHQCHGAIGYTTELNLHLYHKRAIVSEMLLGGAAYHRERIAAAWRANGGGASEPPRDDEGAGSIR